MIIFPAIDLYKGQVVRLYQGDYSQMTIYSDDPVKTAIDMQNKGATHLHIVDLYGAKEGETRDYECVKSICQNTNLSCEIGGGIRSLSDIEKYISSGIDRVILGTKAITDPDFLKEAIKEFGSKMVVGVDSKNGKVAIKGWTETVEKDSFEFVGELSDMGVEYVIYTDISRDGSMKGINASEYEKLKGLNIKVIASGGVSSYLDIEKIRNTGCYGAIIGKALYTKDIELGKAIDIAR